MPPSSKCSLPRPVANATGTGAAWPYPWDPPISSPCAPAHVTSAVFSHRHVVLQATIVRALIGEQGWDVCSCDKPWIYSFILVEVEAVANAIFLFWQYLVAQFESLCISSKSVQNLNEPTGNINGSRHVKKLQQVPAMCDCSGESWSLCWRNIPL